MKIIRLLMYFLAEINIANYQRSKNHWGHCFFLFLKNSFLGTNSRPPYVQNHFEFFFLVTGISVGPLVCGVIGATKPVFDIWGDTVNEASRMDSTGTLGCIQVSQRTASVNKYTIV